MNEKEMTIPADVDRVSLRIERRDRVVRSPTLRELLMSTRCTNDVRIMIKETFPRGEGSKGSHAEFHWSVVLPGMMDSMENRKKRVETFACATLCDTGMLLDEREVSIEKGDGSSMVTFLLEANPVHTIDAEDEIAARKLKPEV